MKKFNRLVGLLLCLAMVLSFVPASILSTTVKAATTTTSDILERIDLSGTVVGTCSSPYSSSTSYKNQNWYSTQNPTWKTLDKFVNGSTSDEITYSVSSGERGDVYLDLTKKDSAGISADQFKMHYGAGSSSASMPTVTVILELANGSTKEKTFTTNWSGTTAGTPITWDFGETLTIKGIYAYSPSSSKFSVSEIELYHYIEIPYLETAKLNGVDIGEYVIVYSADELDYNLRAAEYIQEAILAKTGRTVSIVEDNTAEAANEIIVGQTNRSLSTTLTAPGNLQMKFAIQANGTKIAMEADYFIIAGAAYYFAETYISTSNFENTVPAQKQELSPITKKAKNYIFLIGDGMGYMQTRFFEKFGASPTTGTYGYGDGEDVFYGYYFPYQGESMTANVYGTITDSAAGGTALATGYKTINGYVGRDMYENDITNLSELAWNMGKAVGIMSTEGSDGATPASFSAHTSGRYDDEVITDQDALEAKGYLFVERYRGTQDAANAVFKTFTAEEFGRWDAKVQNGLNQLAKDPDGFFLMYEEAYIDKNCHNDDQQNAYRTVYRFNQHIANFMEFAMYNPDTFVLITADHETSGLTEEFVATQFNAPPEKGCDHSLQNVPVFVYGEGGEVFNNVVAQNTSIGRTFAHIMTDGNADDFGDPQYPILVADYEPEPEDPNAPVLSALSGLATPEFGYYTDNNTNGALTSYYNNSYLPANLVDGDHSNQTRSQYYTYAEVTSGAKVPAIVFDLGGEKDIAAVEVDTYKATYYSIDNFDIQVYNNGTWTTVKSVTGAFSGKTHGEACAAERYEFTATTGTKVRILVTKLSDMTSYGAEDAEMATGSYIRLKEITIYEDLNAGASTDPTTPPATQPTTNPTQAPTLPAGGELEEGEIYKVINNATILTGIAGYINASGTFVEVSGEGECLVEGAYGRCAFLNQNISGEKAAIAEIDLSTTKNIGAIEITGDRNTQLDPTNFEIQVWYNGAWTTVKTVTNAFTSGSRSQTFTFGPYETNKVRLYITSHEGDYCSIGEIELYEVTTGTVANKIDLSGCTATSDSGVTAAGTLTSAVVGSVIDGDKSTIITFNSNNPTIAIDLTNSDGTPTNVSAFSLYGNRSGNRPVTVEIQVQLTNGGSYTSLGTYSFSANNVPSYPFQPYYTELGASYDVYGFKMIVKSLNYAETAGCALAEIALYGGEEGAAPDAPTTPTEPAPTQAPTQAPTVAPGVTKEKVDLTGTVIGACSTNSATAGSYDDFTWWSDGRPTWKNLAAFVDGNLSTYFSFGAGSGERSDLYLDLSKGGTGYTPVGEFTIYHSSQGNVPSIMVVLILEDGTEWTKTYATNWAQFAGSLNFTETFTENKNAVGMYIWQNGSDSAHFGDIEIYQYVGGETPEPTTPPATQPTTPPATEPTTPPATQPTTPVVQGTGLKVVSPTKLSTVFGCYTDGTGNDESTFSDGNDGYCVTDGWFGRAGYSERTSAQGKIALIMTLSETKTLGGIEITGNNTSNDPTKFDVQAYVDGQWVTVYTQTSNAFTSSIRTVMCEFNQTVTTNKVRILVHEVSVAANDCRLQEVVLYETAEKAFVNLDLNGKVSCTDANPANPVTYLVDNDNKDNIFLGSNTTVNFGTATKIDGFRLDGYRGNATYPSSVKVEVQLTAGGAYTSIGTFSTGFSGSYPWPVMDVEFGQTYEVYGVRFSFGAWCYLSGLEIFQYVEAPAEPEQPDTILVGSSYSVHLIEPWALRTYIQFANGSVENLLPVANFTDYGAYAIIGNKFEGTTAEELMDDADAVKYTKADGNITVKDATTLTFDFYDGLYSYNLSENVYWVAYFEDANGVHYTSVQIKSLTDVADSLLGKDNVSDTEKAVLNSMKDLKDAVITLRGEDANLGNVYAPGVANTNGLGERNTGYQFGTSSQIKLIEPWGIRVRVLMREKTAAGGVFADYEDVDDYGLIFFHDKTGKYNGTMTAAQMSAETDAKVYSKSNGNATIVANGVTAVYDQGIYTYDLDKNLYCLPYIVVDGEYYYPEYATCWNLLGEMTEYSQNTDLTAEERAVFSTMLEMYDNVQEHLGNR